MYFSPSVFLCCIASLWQTSHQELCQIWHDDSTDDEFCGWALSKACCHAPSHFAIVYCWLIVWFYQCYTLLIAWYCYRPIHQCDVARIRVFLNTQVVCGWCCYDVLLVEVLLLWCIAFSVRSSVNEIPWELVAHNLVQLETRFEIGIQKSKVIFTRPRFGEELKSNRGVESCRCWIWLRWWFNSWMIYL